MNIMNYQILCGDRIEVMNNLLANSVHLIVTSPPYNVGIEYDNHDDTMPYDEYLDFLNETWIACERILIDGGRIAINIPSITHEKSYQPLFSDVIQQMKKIGFVMRCDILWYKEVCSSRTAWGSWQSPSNPYIVQPYEFILVFSKGTKKLKGNKEDIDITKEEFIQYSNGFWNICPESANQIGHPAPFPQELAYRLIKFYSYKGNVILDPFNGSGTTCVVAYKTGRHCIGIDKSEKYNEIAVKRLKTKEVFKPNHFMKDISLKYTNKLF